MRDRAVKTFLHVVEIGRLSVRVDEYLFLEWVEMPGVVGVSEGGAWYEAGWLVRGNQGRGGGGRGGHTVTTPTGIVPIYIDIFITFRGI